ncbi:MAG: exodeoxyribonuclease VII large subunit [Fastidiosipilaceae bacterium]|jgi:exodeoxyribonuclease VII large subunit
MTEIAVVAVSQLNNYVARLIGAQSALAKMKVRGELSNFKRYRSGHLYFSLKDANAVVSSVMFAGDARSLRFEPKDGDEVICDCRAGFYERDGKFQLYVSRMTLTGQGDLFEAFEALRKKLEAEGLFDPVRKRPLKLLPRKIGVVTSASGAVIRDIIHVLSRRFPNFELSLFPCKVQGDGAAATIIEGIRLFNERGDCDVLIVGRGGGSIEDLWAFNDEALARAIHSSRIPVISAVGHETDFTIADFVADVRAPTPSAAAEYAMPVKAALEEQLAQSKGRLANALRNQLKMLRLRATALVRTPALTRPLDPVNNRRQELDVMQDRMTRALTNQTRDRKESLSGLSLSLDALSPLKVLARGFGLVTDRTVRPITTVRHVAPGDVLDIRLIDGTIHCLAESVDHRSLPLNDVGAPERTEPND